MSTNATVHHVTHNPKSHICTLLSTHTKKENFKGRADLRGRP